MVIMPPQYLKELASKEYDKKEQSLKETYLCTVDV